MTCNLWKLLLNFLENSFLQFVTGGYKISPIVLAQSYRKIVNNNIENIRRINLPRDLIILRCRFRNTALRNIFFQNYVISITLQHCNNNSCQYNSTYPSKNGEKEMNFLPHRPSDGERNVVKEWPWSAVRHSSLYLLSEFIISRRR